MTGFTPEVQFSSTSLPTFKLSNESISPEWKQLSASLPSYSGATYIRWGRLSCPPSSDMIYRGQMAGPDISSNGGGSNYQCLPDDPEYSSYRVPATMSSLRNIVYIESPNIMASTCMCKGFHALHVNHNGG